MNLEAIKKLACDRIDSNADRLIRVSKDILANPETGFREFKSSKIIANELSDLGIPFEDSIAVTGIKATLHGAQPQSLNVAVLAEMDSLKVLDHPFADGHTNGAHACGHHCQIGMLLGVAVALKAPEVLENLVGKVSLMALPAEEYIEIGYRNELKKQGKIEFLGGKPEFIRLGHFDDVDIAMMTHTSSFPDLGKISLGGTNNGLIAKSIHFHGKASHAGSAPHLGVNALNAAMIALSAIHAQRETYRDQDTIRVHPIITDGGLSVSSVPSDVRMETYVRGASIDDFMSASQKVDRALRSGALAVGGSVTISTMPGYLPIVNNTKVMDVYAANASSLVGKQHVYHRSHQTGSTDMGDVSQLMPVIHPYVEAASGVGHGKDYVIDDYELGVLTASKIMAMTVIDLMTEGPQNGHGLMKGYKPKLSKRDYLSLLRGMSKEEIFDQ